MLQEFFISISKEKESEKMNKKDLKVITFLAYKNIAKSKATFLVIVAVMAMSFLSITFFAAIIDGLGYEFEEGMIKGLTGHLMIEPTENNKYLENTDSLVSNIKKIPATIIKNIMIIIIKLFVGFPTSLLISVS